MNELVVELEYLWSSGGGPPDLLSWYHSVQEAGVILTIPPTQLLAALNLDQKYRWRTDHPWMTEEYLFRLRTLPDGVNWALELMAGEIDARSYTHQPVADSELVARFPQFSEALRSRLHQVKANSATVEVHIAPITLNGRYRLDQQLGEGHFGKVYLARDLELHRDVAVKVPSETCFQDASHQDAYLREARMLAGLDHPHILPIYDVCKAASGQIYLVSRYVQGPTLRKLIMSQRLSFESIVALLAPVADALAYAHEKRIIHRDVKPENILVDETSSHPVLADFGLAVQEQDYRQWPRLAGTPAYMSPEQIRGEGHRLDGRSDLFSLGVVLYEMLTGEHPFRSRDRHQLFHDIACVHPPAPRSINSNVPPELERMCLKAMSKRVSDRYRSSSEFAGDLRAWLQRPNSVHSVPNQLAMVKPKGLRAFDSTDASFFLQLLPGLRNRDGLPESVAFWKQRLEAISPEDAFSVGLIYGPSGCGKSSFVKAGLIPHLAQNIIAVYVEAEPDETERRICSALRRRLPNLRPDADLAEVFAFVRLDRAARVVIFVDQFEQWLDSNIAEPDCQMLRALRQCDGLQIQLVLMVRDDFFLSVSRLMEQIDTPILLRQNCMMVDLFDLSHATKVLYQFGAAYGQLPVASADAQSRQLEFVQQAVDTLAEDGRVIPVRLALFAAMVRDKPWEPATLQKIGGFAGVGVAFLDETFTSHRSDMRYKIHERAARRLMKALLPAIDSEIRGARKTVSELRVATGYQHEHRQFDALLRMLDSELRLITPTASVDDEFSLSAEHVTTQQIAWDSVPSGPNQSQAIHENSLPSGLETPIVFRPGQSRAYQLTHDYLVPSLREWLTRKQKETNRGRAELKLEERATIYWNRPERPYLPSLPEWLWIRISTYRRSWTRHERVLMQHASKYHLIRCLLLTFILLVSSLLLQSILANRDAKALADTLFDSGPEAWPQLLKKVDEYNGSLDQILARPVTDIEDVKDSKSPTFSLPARLALVPRDPSHIDALSDAMLNGNLNGVSVIRQRLTQYRKKVVPHWMSIMRSQQESPERRFRAAMGLVGIDSGTPMADLKHDDLDFIASQLTRSFSEHQPQLRALLHPLGARLVPFLDILFDHEESTEQQQVNAAVALVEFAGSDLDLLADLITRASPRQADILLARVGKIRPGEIHDALMTVAREQPEGLLSQKDRVSHGRRRANAAIALLRNGDRTACAETLRVTDDPEAVSQFIHRCRLWGIQPIELIQCLDRGDPRQNSAAGIPTGETSRLTYAILLTLGSYSFEQIPMSEKERLIERIRSLYLNDPSAAVHSASRWLLRRWGYDEDVQKMDQSEMPFDPTGRREWFRYVIRKTQGDGLNVFYPLTFVAFSARKYQLGSSAFMSVDADRSNNETERLVEISRTFAVCDQEVNWGLYSAMMGGDLHASMTKKFGWHLSPSHPAFGATWFDWIDFCRVLTREYRGAGDQWQCYRSDGSTFKATEDVGDSDVLLLHREGFRMPTEAEWEAAARAGHQTPYAFGGDISLLGHYGWFHENSDRRPQRCASKLPAINGMFDIQGNLFEWTHDWYGPLSADGVSVDPQGPASGSERVLRGGCWGYPGTFCRSASRHAGFPDYIVPERGLRLALTTSVAIDGHDSATKVKDIDD